MEDQKKISKPIIVAAIFCLLYLLDSYWPYGMEHMAEEIVRKFAAGKPLLYLSAGKFILTIAFMLKRALLFLIVWVIIWRVKVFYRPKLGIKEFCLSVSPLIIMSALISLGIGRFAFNETSKYEISNIFFISNIGEFLTLLIVSVAIDICLKAFFLRKKPTGFHTKFFLYFFLGAISIVFINTAINLLPYNLEINHNGQISSHVQHNLKEALLEEKALSKSRGVRKRYYRMLCVCFESFATIAFTSISFLLIFCWGQLNKLKQTFRFLTPFSLISICFLVFLFLAGIYDSRSILFMPRNHVITNIVRILQSGNANLISALNLKLINEKFIDNSDFSRLDRHLGESCQFLITEIPNDFIQNISKIEINKNLPINHLSPILGAKRCFLPVSESTIQIIDKDYQTIFPILSNSYRSFLLQAGIWFLQEKKWEQAGLFLSKCIFLQSDNESLSQIGGKHYVLSAFKAIYKLKNINKIDHFIEQLKNSSNQDVRSQIGKIGLFCYSQKEYQTALKTLTLAYDEYLKIISSINNDKFALYIAKSSLITYSGVLLSLLDETKREARLLKMKEKFSESELNEIDLILKRCEEKTFIHRESSIDLRFRGLLPRGLMSRL